MSDTRTAYATGDSVIATQCLVSVALPGGIRVEIPSGTRGSVVAVDPLIRWAPYLVVFEAGYGGLVDIQVSAEQIGRVYSHEPLVPIVEEAYVPDACTPTFQRPHRWCKRLHEIIFLEALTAYGIVLAMRPETLLIITAVFVFAAYAHQILFCRRLTWIPEVVRGPIPDDDEELDICTPCGRVAAVFDLAVVTVLGALLFHYTAFRITGGWPDPQLFKGHVVLVGVVALLKVGMHHRAAHIYSKHN